MWGKVLINDFRGAEILAFRSALCHLGKSHVEVLLGDFGWRLGDGKRRGRGHGEFSFVNLLDGFIGWEVELGAKV